MVEIKHIDHNDKSELLKFVQNLGSSENSFRYFKNRSIDVISNHVYTVLAYDTVGNPVGYGHLDLEGNNVWLGIAVIEASLGNGIGKAILNNLLHKADTKKIDLCLSVDKDNHIAKKLYENSGFMFLRELSDKVILMKREHRDTEIYVSSLAFLSMPIDKAITICKENNLSLEFSSGMPFEKNMEDVYSNCDLTRMPHNYFPAPEIPFVLNLASSHEGIRRQSIEHCKNGLRLSKNSNSPFFAAHAGFCIDPNPEELGRKIEIKVDYDRSAHKGIFLESVKEVLKVAHDLEIDFLIENNVLAPFNFEGNNPLLCAESEDIEWLFNEITDSRLGLLLDTAHLKVSCKTLNLNLTNEFKLIAPFVKGLHHSDNDGEKDDNQSIDREYWFLPFIEEFNELIHVLEVKNLSVNQILTQFSILRNYGS